MCTLETSKHDTLNQIQRFTTKHIVTTLMSGFIMLVFYVPTVISVVRPCGWTRVGPCTANNCGTLTTTRTPRPTPGTRMLPPRPSQNCDRLDYCSLLFTYAFKINIAIKRRSYSQLFKFC